MFRKFIDKIIACWEYCSVGVWSDTRPDIKVNFIKTINLTVRSFMSSSAQAQACALTYRTLLAVVPALAIVFAIGRGFGFQNLLEDELFLLFPGQRQAVTHALVFVDSYLDQASEGIFLGIGIAFLLWTVISLIDNVEATFNTIWGIQERRSYWRKITDYTAIILILPVLMICGGGLSMFLSTSIQKIFHFSFMTPVISVLFELGSYIFTCLFFAAAFMLLPNTKVRLRPAVIAGALTGAAFLILQWLFVTGQMWVAKYNAIYGSFSFLPLFLIWMQLVWVIVISGSLVCYASQNIFAYTFSEQISHISRDYYEKVLIAITALVVQEFTNNRPPVTAREIVTRYGIPSKLVGDIINQLVELKIISRVIIDERHDIIGYQPAINPADLTINYLRRHINERGTKDFIPQFDTHFSGVISTIDNINLALVNATDDIRLSDIDIDINAVETKHKHFHKPTKTKTK